MGNLSPEGALDVGDRLVGSGWLDHEGAPISLYDDAWAGSVTVLFVSTSGKSVGAAEQVAKLGKLQEEFRSTGAQVFVVTADTVAENADLAKRLHLTFPVVCNPDFATGRALGLNGPGLLKPAKPGVPSWRTMILDECGRVERLLDPKAREDDAEVALSYCTKRMQADPPVIVTRQPPVLIVPNLVSRDHCARLIAYWATGQRYEGGVASAKGDKHTLNRSVKVREDVALPDRQAEAQELFAVFRRRLFPEIRKVFKFHVSRAETLRLGCYDACDGGVFKAHRDDTSQHVMHRRFAMSLLLNTGDYEGGYLRFPEYGPQLYHPPAGSAVIFSCSLLHEVTPVKSGKRFGLFGFFHGEAEEAIRRSRKAEYEYTLVDYPAKVYSVATSGPQGVQSS